MLSLWERQVMVGWNYAFKVRLPHLVASTRTSASELDSCLSQASHKSLHQIVISMLEDEVECIVTGTLQLEVRAIL